MFNFLQVVNPTAKQFTLQAKSPTTGGTVSWTIGPHKSISSIPEIYYDQLLEKYSSIGLLIQEMPINYVGLLPAAPTRCYPGKAGTVGYFENYSYYCVTDGEWLREPAFPNQDQPANCPLDPGASDDQILLSIDEEVVLDTSDETGKKFVTKNKYIKGSITVYLNGLPYSDVIEDGDKSFRLYDMDAVPDILDRVSVTYKYI